VKSEQLLTQGKIFEDEILAGPECTNNPAEEVPEPYDHAQNLTGTLPIELGAKSLILRVYDVLMNDTGHFGELIQDQLLVCPICGSIALADGRCQSPSRRQLDSSPHLRLPTWLFNFHVG